MEKISQRIKRLSPKLLWQLIDAAENGNDPAAQRSAALALLRYASGRRPRVKRSNTAAQEAKTAKRDAQAAAARARLHEPRHLKFVVDVMVHRLDPSYAPAPPRADNISDDTPMIAKAEEPKAQTEEVAASTLLPADICFCRHPRADHESGLLGCLICAHRGFGGRCQQFSEIAATEEARRTGRKLSAPEEALLDEGGGWKRWDGYFNRY